MKIQPNLFVIQGQKHDSRRPVKKNGETESLRPEALDPSPEPKSQKITEPAFPRTGLDVVSRENQRALDETSVGNPKDAEKILKTVTDGLKGLNKADLRSLHRLEGLVHVFQA